MTNQKWKNKISNPAQLGGIETPVMDNGRARGTRIAWINAGADLRYKVIIDRGMDIADAFFNQYNLTWLSHLGIVKYYETFKLLNNETILSFYESYTYNILWLYFNSGICMRSVYSARPYGF